MKDHKCINCQAEIEENDNFCWKCGHWSAKGYSFFNNNEEVVKIVEEGNLAKHDTRNAYLIFMLLLTFIIFLALSWYRGMDIFRPVFYLEKQVYKYIYGYNVSILKTDNQYYNKSINSLNDANNYIIKDLNEQDYKCGNNIEVHKIEDRLEKDYAIKAVNFCDISLEETKRLATVIDKIYNLFPSVKGYLTNISITNAKEQEIYIAYFEPIYQFVNSNADISSFNKVNKTQILLNSYYFLNEETIKNSITEKVAKDWYVNDATWESLFSHEFGHYISFVALLKLHGINSITFETKDNYQQIQQIIDEFNGREYSNQLLNEAYNNYKLIYSYNGDINTFALSISKYAANKDKSGKLIADETLAEAIHDYYLHGSNAKAQSLEIVKVINSKL